MKKRVVCITLSTLLFCSCVVPALAYSEDSDRLNEIGHVLRDDVDTEFQAYMDELCDSYTITFQETELSVSSPTSQLFTAESYETTEKMLYREHNEAVAQQAKDYVMSLGLAQDGYEYLEEACLEELDRFAEMDDFQVLSYTVHVPKHDANSRTSAVAPLANYFFFGTYGGRDFYFYYPSTTEGKTTNYKQTSKSVLQQWANNTINLVMVFSDVRVSAGFAAFQSLMGAPKNYTVKTGAYTENYFNANVHTRNICTLYGNGKYETMSTQQFAEVFPYAVFHPVDSPTYKGAYTKDYGYGGQVYSPKYKYSTSTLCKEAWQIYNGAVVLDKHDKVNMQAAKNYWQ